MTTPIVDAVPAPVPEPNLSPAPSGPGVFEIRQKIESDLASKTLATENHALFAAVPEAIGIINAIRVATAKDDAEFSTSIGQIRTTEDIIGAANAYPAIYAAYEQALVKIQQRLDEGVIGPAGATTARANAAFVRDEALAQRDAALDKSLESLPALYPPAMLPPVDANAAGAAQVIALQFENATPEYFLKTAIGILGRASDPSVAPADRLRLNQQIETAYLPLCDRRANRPEAHAKNLSGAYDQIASAMKEHLHVTLGNRRAERAKAIAETIASERRVVKGMLAGKLGGKWDDFIISTAAPTLYGRRTPK